MASTGLRLSQSFVKISELFKERKPNNSYLCGAFSMGLEIQNVKHKSLYTTVNTTSANLYCKYYAKKATCFGPLLYKPEDGQNKGPKYVTC